MVSQYIAISILDLYSPAEVEKRGKGNTPSISDEAMKLAQDYDGLDDHGQRVLRFLADEEKDRYKADESVNQFDPKTQIVKIAGHAGRLEERQLTKDQVSELMKRIYALDDPEPTV